MVEEFLRGMDPEDKLWALFWFLFFGTGTVVGVARAIGSAF